MTVYTFGSYAQTPAGRDIDLLIVYDNQVVALREALLVRKQIARRVIEQTGKQSHICLLAKDEPERLVFVREENAKIIIKQATRPSRTLSKTSLGKRMV
jgi:predicted nucleotidyltransferase